MTEGDLAAFDEAMAAPPDSARSGWRRMRLMGRAKPVTFWLTQLDVAAIPPRHRRWAVPVAPALPA